MSREVTANGGRPRYRAAGAEQQALIRSTRPKRCKLAEQPVLRDVVVEKLRRRWSPQQIAGWLKTTYPDDPEMQGVARDDLSHPVDPVPRRTTQLLGHASAAMTLDVYAGLFADDLDSVAMALDALVPSQRSTSGSTGPSAPALPSETPG